MTCVLQPCHSVVHAASPGPPQLRERETQVPHLFLAILLEKGEEEEEALLGGHDDVALLEPLVRRRRALVVDAEVERRRLEGEARQRLDLRRLRRAEEHRLAVGGQQLENLLHLLLKANLQAAVRFVDH